MRNLQRVGWDPDEKPVKKPTASPALLKGRLAVMKARATPPHGEFGHIVLFDSNEPRNEARFLELFAGKAGL